MGEWVKFSQFCADVFYGRIIVLRNAELPCWSHTEDYAANSHMVRDNTVSRMFWFDSFVLVKDCKRIAICYVTISVRLCFVIKAVF